MESFRDMSVPSNPWNKQNAHPLDKLLELSNVDQQPLIPEHQVDEEFSKTSIAKDLDVLRSLTKTASDIRKTRNQIKDITLDKHSHDLTHTDSLKVKLEDVQQLLHDLECANQNQTTLTQMLQQPYQGNHIKLKAEYHSNAVRAFENITLCLSDLQQQCEVLKWNKENQLGDSNIQQTLLGLSRRTSQLQRQYTLTSNHKKI